MAAKVQSNLFRGIVYSLLALYLICSVSLVYLYITDVDILGNNIAVLYYFCAIFLLPGLLSVVILRKAFFGLHSALFFLIYPIVYYLGVFLLEFGVSIPNLYYYFSIGVLTVFPFLLVLAVLLMSERHLKETLNIAVYTLIAIGVFLLSVYLYRDTGSIISTDMLIHKTVLNGMAENPMFRIMPSSFSTTFTDQAYPILMYHSLLMALSRGVTLNFEYVGYFSDLTFSIISGMVIFKIFAKQYSKGFALLGTILTLHVFENLAYSYHFFIPQTFAFLLFLFIVSQKYRSNLANIIAIVLLLISHLFIGVFLTFLLLAKSCIYNDRFRKSWIYHSIVVLLVLFLISLFFSAAGYSLEGLLQKNISDWVGSVSNLGLRGITLNLFKPLGFVWLLIIPYSLSLFYKDFRGNPLLSFALVGFLTGIITQYLGPVFSGKFLLGFGLFSSIIIVDLIYHIEFRFKVSKYLFAGVVVFLYIYNYNYLFLELSSFLTQNDGFTSAVVKDDHRLVDYWNENSPDCVLLGDPQTQLIVHSLGTGRTVRGLYLDLSDRRLFESYINDPSENSLKELLNSETFAGQEYSSEKRCVDISARLIEMVSNQHPWTEYIFSYDVQS